MKNVKKSTPFVFVLCCAMSFYACGNSSTESKKSGDETKVITEAFNAEFIGTYVHAGPDTLQPKKCSDSLSVWRAIVDCKGTANVMGDVNVHFDFCGDKDGNYGNTYAYMVDESQDTLFITCEGQVIQGKTEGHPQFVTSYWKDNFEILGGTGKYEGVTGSGMTDDYNSSEDPNSHHRWKGTITLHAETN